MRNFIALAIMAAVLIGSHKAEAKEVKIRSSRDTWVSGMGREADTNMGRVPRMKLKFYQEFGLMDFNVKPLKGKKITEVWLYVKPAGGQMFGLNGGSDLRWLSISTLSHDWVEGSASDEYQTDNSGHGATFNESSFKQKNWGWDGARIYDVALGNGNSLRSDVELIPENGWLKARLDPRVIQALVAGAGYGIFLMDGNTYHGVNNYVATRESDAPPYIRVTVAGDDNSAPQPPADLKVVPAPNQASATEGAVWLIFTVPQDAFAYHVKIGGREISRWQIPFASAGGSRQAFYITGLKPAADVTVKLRVVDAAGNLSEPVSVSAETSPALTVPKLPEADWKPAKGGGPLKLTGNCRVWAFPEITKVDPVNAEVKHEKVADDFKARNAVWESKSKTIRLAAARAEIISFQLALEGKVDGCHIAVSDLKGPEGAKVAANGVRLWRNWYVKRESEYAIPLKPGETFSCPMRDNGMNDQKLQAVTVDYHIPKDTKPGEYTGLVTLSAGKKKLELKLKVKVYAVTIPDEIHFNPELNCYGGPGRAGSEKFRDSFKLAHYNRCTINRVPYGQGGNTNDDWAPDVDSSGHVTNWSRFDNDLGGLLDGSWFADNPRAGVPVPTLYLPLFEGWPLNFRDYYHPGKGVPMNVKDDKQLLKHDTMAKPIEEAFDPKYKQAWTRSVSDFVEHFKQKGWNRTICECYLNNKPNWGYTVWTLDEPTKYRDWAALNFFAGLWKKGINDPEVYDVKWHEALFAKGLAAMDRGRPTFLFRGDISRMEYQGSVSDDLMTIIYLGGSGLRYPRLTRQAKYRMPSVMNGYGSFNKPDVSNWETAAWCLKAYSLNLDGVLPWQSLAKAGALKNLNQEALIIDTGDKFGHAIASFRVHAARRGAQDCELFRLLQLSRGWAREHIGLLVSQKVPLTAEYKQAFNDEAAATNFGSLTSTGFIEMKEGILKLIEQSEGYRDDGVFDPPPSFFITSRPGGAAHAGNGKYAANVTPAASPRKSAALKPPRPDEAKAAEYRGRILSWLVKSVGNNAGKRVEIPLFGRIQKVGLVDADEDMLTVKVEDNEVVIEWIELDNPVIINLGLELMDKPTPEQLKALAALAAYSGDADLFRLVLKTAGKLSPEHKAAVEGLCGK